MYVFQCTSEAVAVPGRPDGFMQYKFLILGQEHCAREGQDSSIS